MKGWIKLHRQLLDSAVFDNPDLLKLWVWCLLRATHKEHRQMVGLQEIGLQEGQFIFGRSMAAEKLNMSESKVYRLMKKLEGMNNISMKPNNKFTVVTVEKWVMYQGDNLESEQQTNNKRTTNEQQMNTNKNVKNDKNVNKLYNSFFDTYNNQNIIKHKQLTPKMKQAINRALKKDRQEDILKAMGRYGQAFRDKEYPFCTYKMTLDKFLTQGNGYTDWLDEGQKWINYNDFKNRSLDQTTTQRQGEQKFKTKFHLAKSRGDKYTAEELERIVLENSRRKLEEKT